MKTPRLRRVAYIAAPAAMWGLYAALVVPYIAIRALGDDLLPWVDGGAIERAVFTFEPTRALQEHIYANNHPWLDFAGFLLHASWFFLPLGFGIVVTLRERRYLAEYLLWILAACYLADVFFLLFPVQPPWMEAGVHRVLQERAFVSYTGADDNPVAAFPSLHAALPMVIALFFFLRCERSRGLGWVAAAFALLIGAGVVYLGEHWLVDVLAGYLLAGSVALIFVSGAVRRWTARVPGDPVGRLSAWNNAVNGPNARGTQAAVVLPFPQRASRPSPRKAA